MGRTVTPKYILDMLTSVGKTVAIVWNCKTHGKPNTENIEKYIDRFNSGLKKGEVNEYLGSEYYITKGIVYLNGSIYTAREEVATFRKPSFEVI